MKPLSVPFEQHLQDDFVRRLHQCNNTSALEFISNYDITNNGIKCIVCIDIKPLYCYSQDKNYKIGIRDTKCTKCTIKARCPYKMILQSMKSHSKTRCHDPPELSVDDLKGMFETQKSRCPVKNEQMKESYKDGNPYNMSPERKDNKKHYTKDNVVLICQKYQIGHGYDFSIEEIRSWFQYDKTLDGFIYDHTVFIKPDIVKRKPRDANYNRDSKTCLDCDKVLPLSSFSGKMSYCKSCHSIRRDEHSNTPYGFMLNVVRGSKNHAKKRGGKRKRNDTSNEYDEDLFTLFVNIIKKQGGRCDDTGIPFVYEVNHKFALSPDRIDNSKGYVVGNVRMIISPLNTQNNK